MRTAPRTSRSSRRRSTAPGRENWRDLVPHRPGRLISRSSCLHGLLVRLEREDGLPRIVVRRLADGEEHAIAFAEEAYSLGARRRLRVRRPTAALHLLVDDHAERGLRLRPGDARAHAAQAPGGAERPRSRRLRDAPPVRAGARRRDACRSRCCTARTRRSTARAPCLLYGYGSYGIAMPAALLDQPAVAGRPRLRLRHRAYPRRQGQGLALVPGRQAARRRANTFTDFIAAGEHLRAQGYTARGRIVAHGGSAGGMLMGAVANMAPGPVRRHHRRGAVRRRAQHHARRHAAADAARMAGVGQPDRRRAGDSAPSLRYSPYDNVRRAGLSGDPGARRADRSARHLLGAGQVDREAARARHRRQPDRCSRPTWRPVTAAPRAASTG